MQSLIRTFLSSVAVAALVVGLAAPVHADPVNTGDVVDGIDGTFGSGGGAFNGSITALNWDWFIFAANAGDVIHIETIAPISNYDTRAALLQFVGVGLPSAGDIVGTDLTLLVNDDDSGVGLLSMIDFNIVTSGIYLAGVGGFGTSFGDYTLALSGNTASVPEPSTIAILSLGLLGLAWRGKQKLIA